MVVATKKVALAVVEAKAGEVEEVLTVDSTATKAAEDLTIRRIRQPKSNNSELITL